MLCERSSRRIAIDTAHSLARQGECGLARGVPAAHDDHRQSRAQPHLELGRGVVHARALEPLEVVDAEALVSRTRRDDDCSRGHLAVVREHDRVEPGLDAETGDRAR